MPTFGDSRQLADDQKARNVSLGRRHDLLVSAPRIRGNRVVVNMQNRYYNPDPDGAARCGGRGLDGGRFEALEAERRAAALAVFARGG